MRNIFTISLLTFFLSMGLQAQDRESTSFLSKITFGTELGIIYGTPIAPADKGSTITVGPEGNQATITVDDAKGRPGLGLHGAIFARYHIKNQLALQIGLAYNAKKATYESPVYNQDYTYNQVLNLPDGSTATAVIETFFNGEVDGEFNNQYLEIPISIRYYWNDKWSVVGGGYTAFLLKGGHDVWATGIVGDNFDFVEREYSNESENIGKIDYGLSAGLNYKIFGQFETELLFSSGLRTIFSSDYQLAEDTVRNVYVQLKANYTFKL